VWTDWKSGQWQQQKHVEELLKMKNVWSYNSLKSNMAEHSSDEFWQLSPRSFMLKILHVSAFK